MYPLAIVLSKRITATTELTKNVELHERTKQGRHILGTTLKSAIENYTKITTSNSFVLLLTGSLRFERTATTTQQRRRLLTCSITLRRAFLAQHSLKMSALSKFTIHCFPKNTSSSTSLILLIKVMMFYLAQSMKIYRRHAVY